MSQRLAIVSPTVSQIRPIRSRPAADECKPLHVAVHAWLRLAARPTALDGTALDSCAEVIVYEAMRRGLPGSGIAVHAALPGSWKHSVDFIVAGIAHVEVLRYQLADLAAPDDGPARRRKYARQWRQKCRVYATLGFLPTVVEPADVYSADRLTAKISEIAARLGALATTVQSGARCERLGRGHRRFDDLCVRVGEVARRLGRFPTGAEMAAAGHGHAANLLKHKGARQRVAAAIGFPPPQEAWCGKRVVGELAAYVRETGVYPSLNQLRAAGKGRLAGAAARLFAGRAAELRTAVAQASEVVLPPGPTPSGGLRDEGRLTALLRPVAKSLGRMPTQREMVAAGLSPHLHTAVSRHVGLERMAGLLGVSCEKWKRRTDAQVLEMLRRAVDDDRRRTGRPRGLTVAVRSRLGSKGISLVRRLGGADAVRRALSLAASAEAATVPGNEDRPG